VEPDATSLAHFAFKAEVDEAGRTAGMQDHFACALGGPRILNIRNGKVSSQRIDWPNSFRAEFERWILLFDTSTDHDASAVLKRQLRQAQGSRRAAHSFARIARLAPRIVNALVAQDLELFGTLLHSHWLAKRERLTKADVRTADPLISLARGAGALGAKVVGSGGGGALMVCTPSANANRVRRAMASAGLRAIPYRLTSAGARLGSL
jgi:D-glycero-alpha-D-manno-heptose-7-phosphate kinase